MKVLALSIIVAVAMISIAGCASETDAAISDLESITSEMVDMAKTMDKDEAMKSDEFKALGKKMQAAEGRLKKLESELTDEQKDRLKKLILSSKAEVDEAWN